MEEIKISDLISLIAEVDVFRVEDSLNHTECFDECFSMICNKLNCDYETISIEMKETTDHYFSDKISSEWKYILAYLYILKMIGELNEDSKTLLSVKDNRILRNSVANLIKIGIFTKLQPKLPGFIAKNYIKTVDIFYSYNILKCTCFTLCKLIDYSTLRVAILSEAHQAILSALYQIAYCPLKVSNRFSQDIYERLLDEKASSVDILKKLQQKIHSTLFVKEIMSLVQPNTPNWFKKAVFQTLNDIIVTAHGLEIISTAILDGAVNDKTQTWKAVDIITKLVLGSKDSNMCHQIFELLDKADENSLVYERIFVNCVKEFNTNENDLNKNIFLSKVVDDLHHFINKDYPFTNHDVTEKVKQLMRLLNIMFVQNGVDNPKLPTNILVKYLDVIFKFYCVTFNQCLATTNGEAKDIIQKVLHDNKEETFQVFNVLLFNIHNKLLPFRNDMNIEVNNQRILASNTSYSVTPPLTEKSDMVMKLIDNDTELTFSFFEYLLNCIANKDQYFDENKADLLDHQEEMMTRRFERKIVVYKLLSELAENKKIQNKIVESPQNIINFFEIILRNSITEEVHKIRDCGNDKFQSLFTIVMVLQAFLPLGSATKFKDYQDIISDLKTIEKETLDIELKDLIMSTLCIIETKDNRVEGVETKKKSKLDDIIEELCDPLLPVRGHALMSLTKLVERRDEDVLRRKQYVLTIFQQNLKDEDSFIYLAAINGLVAFVNIQTDTVLPILCEEYSDFSRNDDESSEIKLKLGEVLVKVTKMLGDMTPKYKALLLNTFLCGARDQDFLIRSSSLSNLGEVCRVLGYKIGTIITEILVCVHDIITTDKSVEARRAGVLVLKQLLAGLENDMIAFLKEEILPIYRALKEIYKNDPDDIMRLQAQLALEELDNNMMNILFRKPELLMTSKIL